MAYYQLAPVLCALVQTELYMHLYLNQVASGTNPNRNQLVLNPKGGSGVTAVNDWSITETPGANNPAIAKAQGLHMHSSQTNNNWYLSLNKQFQGGSTFAGSTLSVMGIFPDNREWTITGGTGAFSMAKGIIRHNIFQDSNIQRIYELNIHAFYTDMTSSQLTPCNRWTIGA